jgi:NAD dependent epimerase/dehydratase
MKKVLVTGSEGFIGSHLVEHLVKKNYRVKAFVLYNSFSDIGWLSSMDKNILNKIEIYFGDIRDLKNLSKSFNGVEYVFHLAALIGIPYSYTSPKSYIDTNIIGTYNILECCLNYKIKKLITTSTSEVYGSALKIPIDENHKLQAQSPYSATKIGADKLTESYIKSFGLKATIVRPFNTYGPRQSTRAIIPTIITQALKKNIIEIGSVYPKREFNYVLDVCAAFEKIIKNNKLTGHEVNVCSGKSISIIDLIKLISKIMGKNIIIEKKKNRERPKNSEVSNLVGSNKKLLKNIRQKNTTSLTQGLKETIEWFSDKKNLSEYKFTKYNI